MDAFFRCATKRIFLTILLSTLLVAMTVPLAWSRVAEATGRLATSTATNPPMLTPTPASTPAPVRVRAGTAQPALGTTTVTIPLDLVVLTDRVNVAVLSLDLQYNAALLRATACTTSQAMTPLLCNIAAPGRVQLAGVAAQGIRVNAIRPGLILTDIHAKGGEPDRAHRLAPKNVPMARPGTAEEVAAAVLWLLSDAASYVTGALLDVSGGR